MSLIHRLTWSLLFILPPALRTRRKREDGEPLLNDKSIDASASVPGSLGLTSDFAVFKEGEYHSGIKSGEEDWELNIRGWRSSKIAHSRSREELKFWSCCIDGTPPVE